MAAKRNCCKKWSATQRQDSCSDGLARVWSYETKSEPIWKHSSCPKSTVRTRVLLVGRLERLGGTKWRRRRAQSASLLITTHLISVWKGQTTSHIARSITICWSIRPPLAMVGNWWMGSAVQFATLSRHYLISLHLVIGQMTASVTAVAMVTVTFLSQRIPMSSRLLGAIIGLDPVIPVWDWLYSGSVWINTFKGSRSLSPYCVFPSMSIQSGHCYCYRASRLRESNGVL